MFIYYYNVVALKISECIAPNPLFLHVQRKHIEGAED